MGRGGGGELQGHVAQAADADYPDARGRRFIKLLKVSSLLIAKDRLRHR
jgi:hypothetical protein